MTPLGVRKVLEIALQTLAPDTNATYQSAFDLTSDNPPALSMRGAVVHLEELPETGLEHGVQVQAVTVTVELRSRLDNPDAAEIAAEYVGRHLQTLMDGAVNLYSLRFVTPELVPRDGEVPSFYTVSAVWGGRYIIDLSAPDDS